MEFFPIPGASPPGFRPPSSPSSSSDPTHSRPPDAPPKTASTSATAGKQPHKLNEIPKLGDFSSLGLCSTFSSTRKPLDHSATLETSNLVQSTSSDAPPTTTTLEVGRLPYNILNVPKLGNFSSLEHFSTYHSAQNSLDQPTISSTESQEQQREQHLTASSQASLGNFYKIFELLGYLTPSSSTPATADMKRTACPYVCPGAPKASDSMETPPNTCPHAGGKATSCQKRDDMGNGSNGCWMTPSKSRRKSRNSRSGRPWNDLCPADTDSDWRSPRSSPSPSGYETGLTTPPRSPTRNYGHRRSSSPRKPSRQSSKQDDDVAFEYVFNDDSPRVAVKKSDIQSKILYQKHDFEKQNDYTCQWIERECLMDDEVANAYPKITEGGVHVFADVSNIYISLVNTVKKLLDVPSAAKLFPNPEFDWDMLRDIACRGRPAKTLKAGCSINPDRSRNPAFIQRLCDAGFEVEVRDRVLKQKGQYVEKYVDESIQLNIGECIKEHRSTKGTLVLVTGDGKPAEHASGFKAYAEYALREGWNVEVVCWTVGCSKNWRDESWDRYGRRYRLITLDHYLEDLWDKDY